jgi:hypothetical protein
VRQMGGMAPSGPASAESRPGPPAEPATSSELSPPPEPFEPAAEPTRTPEPPLPTPEPRTATPEPPTATPEPPTATSEPPPPAPEPPDQPLPQGSGGEPLNLNTATYDQLRTLKLSVTQTGRVLAHRERVGRFESVEDLEQIPGFPREFLDALKPHLTV